MTPVDPRYFVDPTPSLGARLGNIFGVGTGGLAKNLLQQQAFKALNLPGQSVFLPPAAQAALIKQSQKGSALQRLREKYSGNSLAPMAQPITNPDVTPTGTINPMPGINDQTVPPTTSEVETPEYTPRGLPSNIPSEEEIRDYAAVDPNYANVLQKQRDNALASLNSWQQKNYDRNEPIVEKLNKELRTLETEDTEFARMEVLDKSIDKFPKQYVVAVGKFLGKDGEISDLVKAGFTEEAQEYLKLIKNQLQNISAGGGKITNQMITAFEARLPQLINSPEGRKRIVADLRALNKIRQDEVRGELDIFNQYGTENIPYSEVQKIYRNRYEDRDNEYRKAFIEGKSLVKDYGANTEPSSNTPTETAPGKVYESLPDPSKHKTVIDEDTGQIYKSDGKKWIPQETTTPTQTESPITPQPSIAPTSPLIPTPTNRVRGLGASLFAR